MGLYLRKSFRAGPVRFNLSKSGFGTSIGVKGLRVGATPGGRTYVHAGRGGLYARSNLSSSQRRASSGRTHATDPEILVVDTGVTYGQAPPQKGSSLDAELVRRRRPTYWVVPLIGLIAACANPAVSGVVLVGWVILLLFARLQFAYGEEFGAALHAAIRADDVALEIVREPLEARARSFRVRAADRTYFQKLTYLQLVQEVVTDGVVSDRERHALGRAEALCEVTPDFSARARHHAFRAAYLEAVGDHDLTVDEEESLRHVRQALGLPVEDLAEEITFLDELRELRVVREHPLAPIGTAVKLRAGEECYFDAPGRLLKEKVVKSFQRDGQRYRVVGLTTSNEGQLLITNKRILLVHTGTTAIPLGKILDLEVDHDRRLLRIIKDGSSKPILLTTPYAARAGVILDKMTGGEISPRSPSSVQQV